MFVNSLNIQMKFVRPTPSQIIYLDEWKDGRKREFTNDATHTTIPDVRVLLKRGLHTVCTHMRNAFTHMCIYAMHINAIYVCAFCYNDIC